MPRERGLIRGVAPHGARRAERRRRRCAPALVLALGAALTASAPVAAATLREVRIGRHADYTRIVFETDAPVRYRVSRDASGELRVRLEASAKPRRVGSKSEVLREVAVESEGAAAVARLALAKGDVDVREMVLSDPPRIVLDLSPRAGAKGTAVAERKGSAARLAASAPKPAPAAKPSTPPREIARAPQPAPRAEAQKPAVEVARPAEPKPAETAKAPEPTETAPAPARTPETAAPAAEGSASETGKAGVATAEPRADEPAGGERARAAEAMPAPAREPALGARTEPPSPPAPEPGATAGSEPPREAPLELRLAEKRDPTSERLARAERELDALAGVPAKPRRRDRPAERGPETSAAAEAPPPAAAPPRPTPPSTTETTVPPGAETGTAAPAEPGAPASQPLAAERRARKRERSDRQARFQAAPLAPSPLAFLPSPFDDPLVLTGIGALLGLIGALALVRRRAARAEDGFKSPFDAAVDLNLADEADAARRGGPATFEPVSASPVAAPSPEMGPLFASAAVVSEEDEPSIFDVTAEEAGAGGVEAAQPTSAAPVREPAAAAQAHEDETELTEEEMRLIEELQRRLAHLETRLEEVVDAKERLERHVAAQTEELRVQRAAIARTQRVLRTVVKPEDVATEPVAKT